MLYLTIEILYCARMKKDEEWLLNEKYNGERTEDFFADCELLELGEPLAYIIGTIPFVHSTISLDSHPLIPRPETEFWVEKIIQDMQNNKSEGLSVLDLCAGSGCVGIAVLTEIPHAHVDFAEIETKHHSTISKNISLNTIEPARTHIYGGNLFEHITDTYDYILTNPPYIDPAVDRTTDSVKGFEPALALYGGNEGKELIFKIIEQASAFLKQDGKIVIEHEPEQSESIRTKSSTQGYNSKTYTDQFGLERYTVLIRK